MTAATPAAATPAVAPFRVAVDTETHLFRRGRKAPRLVCLSLAWSGDLGDLPRHTVGALGARPSPADRLVVDGAAAVGALGALAAECSAALVTGARAVEVWHGLLADAAADPTPHGVAGVDLVFHNAPFDLGVLAEAAAVHPASSGPVLVESLDALDRGAIRDTWVRETLIAIATGQLKGAPRGWFALGSEVGLVRRYLGIDRFEEKGKHSPCPACPAPPATPAPACPVCEGFGSVGPWRKRYAQLDGVPLDWWPVRAATYALGDALDTLLVSEAQDRAPPTAEGPLVEVDAAGRPLVVDEVPQTRAAFDLHLFACRGVCVDPDRSEGLDEVVSAIAAEAAEVGVRAGFVRGADGVAAADPSQKPGKPGSKCIDALHALVSECYGGAPPLNEPTDKEKVKAEAENREPVGSIKADRDVLLSSGHPLLIEYAEAGESLTLAKTYVPILREGVALGPVGVPGGPGYPTPCGPITSDPNVLVASGRVSWGRPNWTNPPREGGFRECVVPRPGWVLVFVDYATIEFRALGQICLWEGFGSTIADAFIEGRDPHTEFAGDLLGIPYAEAVARYAAGDPLVQARRQVAKVANYGFPGGMGGERFVGHAKKQGVELHPDRAQAMGMAWELHGSFRRKWPEVLPYFAWIGRRTGTKEDPRRFVLRQYISRRLRGDVGYCDGCNGYFQGLVADGAKAAIGRVVRECYADSSPRPRDLTALAGCRPVLFLHDEIGIEVPCGDGSPRYPLDTDRLTAAAGRLSSVMVDAMRRYVPDLPVEADPAACLRWVKGAKEVRDQRGRLLPADLPAGAVIL